MASSVYPHRDHPHHGAPIYNARALGETLDRVKQEFEVLVGEVAASRDQRERYEATISSQADELEKIRGALHELEAQHNKVRAQYEYEVRVLRSEAAHPHPQPHRQSSLGQREQQQREQQQARPGTASGSGSGSSSALPTLSSPSVFMGGGGPSSAHNVHSAAHSPVLDHHGHPREHSRDPMREGRDGRDLREREREHSRDARELQRARFLEGGSASNKRIKLDQGESARLPLPLIGPGGPAGSPASSSSRRAPTPSSSLPGGFPPQAHTPLGTPAHGAHPTLPPMSLAPPPHPQTPHHRDAPPAHLPYPPPSAGAGPLAPYTNAGAHMNDFLAALDPHAPPPTASSELVKVEGGGRTDGPDWFVVYNPAVKRRVLDVALVHTFVHETVVCCIQFSADGKYLATGCNRTAQIYDVASGRRVCVLADSGPDEKAGMEKAATATGDLYIRSVRFSPDGRYLATGAEDERVRVWDIEKRTIRAVFEGHHQDIYSLDFSADGRRLVSGSGDATVRIWELEEEYEYDEEDRYSSSEYHNGRRRRPPPLVLTAHPETTAPEDDAGVMAVALSPDGTLVAAGCVDALVRVWALAQAPPQNGSRDGSERGGPTLTATLVQVLRGHTNSVHSVVWTKDGSGVVSGALDNTVRVWDLRGAAKREREGKKGMGMAEVGCTVFAGHKDYVLSVGISRDAQWIVSGSKDRGVHFWDRDGVVQCLLQGHKNSVISTSLHPVGNLLATGSGDKLARIWNYNAV